MSIKEGQFPKEWKKGTVIPLPKITNAKEVGDLRPISLLPLPSKLLERIICKRLMRVLEINNILSPQQHGFRANWISYTTVCSRPELKMALDADRA